MPAQQEFKVWRFSFLFQSCCSRRLVERKQAKATLKAAVQIKAWRSNPLSVPRLRKVVTPSLAFQDTCRQYVVVRSVEQLIHI